MQVSAKLRFNNCSDLRCEIRSLISCQNSAFARVTVLLSNDNSRLRNRSNSVKFKEVLPGFPLKTAELTDSIVLSAFSMSVCLVVSKVLFQTLRRSGAR